MPEKWGILIKLRVGDEAGMNEHVQEREGILHIHKCNLLFFYSTYVQTDKIHSIGYTNLNFLTITTRRFEHTVHATKKTKVPE